MDNVVVVYSLLKMSYNLLVWFTSKKFSYIFLHSIDTLKKIGLINIKISYSC